MNDKFNSFLMEWFWNMSENLLAGDSEKDGL